ncbi:MAG: metabolite traffic protein EboE [Planctomycetota bacterium]|jgi:sugar phosphate isomerase/epimerase
MRIQDDPPAHLTYCLNVHPGETWDENLQAIRQHALRVRDRVAAGRPFGLGLRLSDAASRTLAEPDRLAAFRDFLEAEGLYAFTVNGFPFGTFHDESVKDNVYAPDWRAGPRRDYTIRLAEILAALLPDGVPGSISTVPGSYAAWIDTTEDVREIVGMLSETAVHLARIADRTGADICIGLEPEPDCFIENTPGCLRFFEEWSDYGADLAAEAVGVSVQRGREIWRRHVGVCLDTAHAAVQFEDPAESVDRLTSAGIRVCKALGRLGEFADPVYLHQVKARRPDGRIDSFADLPAALSAGAEAAGTWTWDQWRVHFHVPLFFTAHEGLESTSALLAGTFLDKARRLCPNLEIETYTFSVLPAFLAIDDPADGIAREYEWVLGHLAGPPEPAGRS